MDRNDSLKMNTPAILRSYTNDEHRQRFKNIGICTKNIRKYMRSYLVTDYLPAQCVYNLGEYPSRERWEPTEYDEQELDRLKEHGIQLIHTMSEWADRYGIFGGNKLTAINPKGLHRFIEMIHQRGMKVLAYASSGYFQGCDPEYQIEWTRPGDKLGGWYDLPRCSPASPDWRSYFLPRMVQILDEYGFDGVYNDWGYIPNEKRRVMEPAPDEMDVFVETPEYDGAMTDLLCLMYSEVRRRGGILKLHADRTNEPKTGGLKVYDYLWVGEGVNDADYCRETVKNYQPYLVPCIHESYAKIDSNTDHFLHSIPYMLFPLLQGGRPFTGERSVIPIPRLPGLTEGGFFEKVWRYTQAHPNGPYVSGMWDSIPPNTGLRQANADWLNIYMPMVEEGTWAYLEISDSDLLLNPLPQDCVMSVFANRDLYLVLANYSRTSREIATADTYIAVSGATEMPAKIWHLTGRSLLIIKRTDQAGVTI